MKRVLLFLITALLTVSAFSEEQGYAVFDSETGTLTFKYGEMPEGENIFYADAGDETRGWDCKLLKKVVFDSSYSNARPTNTSHWFENAENLTDLIGLEYFNTSNVTDISYMLRNCWSLVGLDLIHFDTSNVKNMSFMFWGCGNLTSVDVTHFDTSQVENMEFMFAWCKNLTNIDVSHFNTKNVINMRAMFKNCEVLSYLDVSHFDTKQVTDMAAMFDMCCNLMALDVSHFDTKKVSDMDGMFRSCYNLTDLDLGNFNTSNVTNMRTMFQGCRSLTNLDLSNFDTHCVNNMDWMFQHCENLTSLNISQFDTRSVTKMYEMFAQCHNLTYLDLSSFDTNKVKVMTNLFLNCNNLATIYVSNKWNTNSLLDSYPQFGNRDVDGHQGLFDGCEKLVGERGTRYSTDHTDASYARIDGGANAPGYFTAKSGSSGSSEEPKEEPTNNNTSKLLKSITWTDGKDTEVAELKYDESGRISEYYIDGKLQNKYSYAGNTIKITEDGDNYTYNISDGLVTTSHTFLDGDYVDIDHNYTYNNNGQLVSIVSTEKESGSSYIYTSTSKWTWDGGNLSSWIGENDEDTETAQYSYYNDLTSEPIIRALFGFNPSLYLDDFYEIIAIYPYIGTLPQNLFKNVIENDAEGRTWNYNYSYEQNNDGDISKVTITFKDHTYIYTFDWDNTNPSSDISVMKKDRLQRDVYYNLQGQRVDNPGKGLYILNGKKMIIK